MKYLIVGLGNIGNEYHETRHNIGFIIADAFAKKKNASFETKRYGSICRFRVKSAEIILLKPSTYMNLSGQAVRYWLQEEKIPLENLLVIVDDLAFSFGTLRIKPQGSDAGHNGLKNIASLLGSEKYARLRIGIGNDFPRGQQIEYVLGTFPESQKSLMPKIIERAIAMAESFCLEGIQIAMNRYNKLNSIEINDKNPQNNTI